MKKMLFFYLLFPLLFFSQGSENTLSFNGSSQIVSVPILSSNIGNTDFTVECFAKFNSFSDFGGVITTFNSNIGGWAIHQEQDGSVTFLIGNSASSNGAETVGSAALLINTWYHISAVKRGGSIELYINGELQGSTVSNRTIPYNVINIGTRYLNFSTWRHNGQLDEIRIWDTALTQTEIRNNLTKKITNSNPNYANLVAYYNFDSGLGSTLVDQTSNGNDGTLVNAPTWQTSAAPIGDENSYLTSVSNGSSLNLAHPGGSDLTVNVTSGTAESIYIYNVNQVPNITTPPVGLDQLSQSNYFGVKAFGSSSLVYEVVYNYGGSSGITEESNLRLSSRADNATLSWIEQSASLDVGANTLTLGGQTGTEFILGSTGGNTLLIEGENLINLKIYPNPTENILRLSVIESGVMFYKIYDINGKRVMEGKLNSSKEISISHLNSGMYFLKLDEGTVLKFLKQ